MRPLIVALAVALVIVYAADVAQVRGSSSGSSRARVVVPTAASWWSLRVGGVGADSRVRRAAHLRRRPHTPALNWTALAACESSGHWHDTAGYYAGGLQFAPSTWASFDTGHFAVRADLATRWQQIVVAERVLRRQGLAAWPACTRKLGWR